jgi:transposase
MDWLIEQKEEIEKQVANRFLTLFDREPDLVFYDITSSYFEGEHSITSEDIRQYGYSRDHRPERRQIVIGVVMTRDGIPLCHHVFSGDTPDKSSVVEVVRDLKERFGLKRVVFVGDRGMLSEGNLEFLLDEGLGFIVCHRLRKNNEIKELVTQTHDSLEHKPEAEEQYREEEREGVKFVLAYNPEIAFFVRKRREEALEKANAFIRGIRTRLRKAQEGKTRGRPLTPEGALVQVRDYLKKHNLLRYYKLEFNGTQGLRVSSDTQARAWEKLIDGKLIVETTQLELPAEEVIERYKGLQIIERGFKTLKSSLKLRPYYHWTEKRIRAHVFICILALQLERYMTSRLSESNMSVRNAIEKLRQIKAGQLTVNSVKTPILTAVGEEHKAIYRQLELSFPKIKDLRDM